MTEEMTFDEQNQILRNVAENLAIHFNSRWTPGAHHGANYGSRLVHQNGGRLAHIVSGTLIPDSEEVAAVASSLWEAVKQQIAPGKRELRRGGVGGGYR